jgi:hypothetical protein
MGMKEQIDGDGDSHHTQKPEQKRIELLPIVNEKITHGQRQNPGDRREDSPLRAVTLAVGKKGIVQKIRGGDEEKYKKISFRPPEDLYETQKGEYIEGRVEQKAVPLVEKIVEQGIESHG